MPSFSFLVFATLDFTQMEQLHFLVQDTIGSIFEATKPVKQMPFKIFLITLIFKETWHAQSLGLWSNFDFTLPPQDGWNQKKPSGYSNQSISRPYLLSIFNEKYNYLLHYLDFFRYKWAQGQRSRGHCLG